MSKTIEEMFFSVIKWSSNLLYDNSDQTVSYSSSSPLNHELSRNHPKKEKSLGIFKLSKPIISKSKNCVFNSVPKLLLYPRNCKIKQTFLKCKWDQFIQIFNDSIASDFYSVYKKNCIHFQTFVPQSRKYTNNHSENKSLKKYFS